MRELGLLLEQIDLVQGRVGKSIFLQHYFKQDAKLLSNRIIGLLPKLGVHSKELLSEKLKNGSLRKQLYGR